MTVGGYLRFGRACASTEHLSMPRWLSGRSLVTRTAQSVRCQRLWSTASSAARGSLPLVSNAFLGLPPPGSAPASEPAPASQPSVVKPPETVHEVQPTIPAGIRSRISEPVVIPVRVEVNERGRVVSAAPEAQTAGVRSYLADLAQKASREWRFRPARTSGGIAVAANKTIQFVFNP